MLTITLKIIRIYNISMLKSYKTKLNKLEVAQEI